MKKKIILRKIIIGLMLVCLSASAAFAQTTEFTYQGKLTDLGTPSATYDFEFRLCDSAAADCTVPLATQQRLGVTVSSGVFTVKLDFGATVFDGSNRWLGIAVKRPAQTTFTTLSPREPLTSAPYSIRALNAANADNTTLFGGLMTDGFVQNTTTQQTGNFNLSGDGTLGGTLLANRVGVGGTPQTGITLDVTGNSAFRTANGLTQLGSPNGETGMSVINTAGASRADFRFNGSTLKLIAGTGTGPPSETNGIIINTLGNVGIGTNSSGFKLEVAGNTFTSGNLNVGTSAVIGSGLSVGNGATVSNGLNVSSGNLSVTNAATVSGGLSVGNGATITGDVGVSNKITTNSLRVNSGGFSFATIAGTYAQDICRDIVFGTLGQCGTSLRRYKTAIENFSGGLNIVSRLRPISFDWKESGQRDVGFIAEEVFEIEPLLTTTGDNGELQGVKYKQLNVVLVNAVNEQQTQIEQQQKQIERQQKQIDALTKFVCTQNPQAEIYKEQ